MSPVSARRRPFVPRTPFRAGTSCVITWVYDQSRQPLQSGGQLSGCGGGSQPLAYLGIHGIRDKVLGVSGGRGLRDRFVRNNGCAAQNPPDPAQGSRTHGITTYAGCSAGHPVEWAAFDEGHIAAPQDGAGGDSGSRTWAPAEVWKFFTQF